MNHDMNQAFNEINTWLQEGRLIRIDELSLFPLEALSQQTTVPAVINLFYLNDAANDADLINEAY